jgi:type IV secretion system protein VirB3
MALNRVPIHRSLHRHNLLAGADRELTLMSALLAGTCIFVAMSIPVAVIGLVLWFFALAMLRMMAKADPKMRDVYVRHIRYRAFYNPRPTPWHLPR